MRLSIAPGDEAQTLSVAEGATVRTCFAGVCGAMPSGDARVTGLAVEGELSGPELPQPITYRTVPGGAFLIPGFQSEGTYLLSNVRLVRPGSGEVLASATPAVVVLEVRQILVASASVRQLSLEELRARGIEVSQQNFQSFNFSVGFAFRGETVAVDFPVLFQEGGQVELLAKPRVELDGLSVEASAALKRWQPPNLIPFRLEVAAPDSIAPGYEPEELPSDAKLFGVIVLPGKVSFLNQFFDARLLVANGAPTESAAILANVTGAVRLPAAVPRETLRLAQTAPPVSPGQKVPVLGATGGVRLAPGEQGAASFTLEGLVPGTHVFALEVGAELERPGHDVLPLAGKLQAAVEVVDARFNLSFNHPDVVREGEPYTLYVTVTNLSRATQNLVTVELDPTRITGAHKERAGDDFSPTVPTLAPGEGATVEYRLVADVTGRCVATTFQAAGGAEGVIRLRTGVGESGIPLSPASLVLPRFTELLPESLVRPNVRLLGLAWSLAVAPPGAIPADLPRLVTADVERRAVDLAEAGQRLYLEDALLPSLEALLLDQLGNRHDLPEYDALRRSLAKGRDAAEALAALLRQEQEARAIGARALLEDTASSMGWARPWIAATLESTGTGSAPTLEVRKMNGVTGVTFLAHPAGDARALRSIPFGEVYGVSGRPGGDRAPLAVVGRLAAEAAYAFVVHGPSSGAPMPVTVSFVAPDPAGTGFVFVDLPSLAVPPGEAWAVEARHATGDARPLSFGLVHLATGVPVANAPAPLVRKVDLPPFRLVGARQDFVLDPHGSGVWYLFNRPPARADAEAEERYEVETRFRGLDTTTSGATLERTTTFAAAAALLQPSSERVVAVRFSQPVSAIVAAHEGQPVVTNVHRLAASELHDEYGNPLSSSVPQIRVENNHTGGLVEGKVVSGAGEGIAGATVRLVRDRVVEDAAGLDAWVVHDLVAERTTRGDGTFFFPFVEEPVLSVPMPRTKGRVQPGFRIQAVAPPGPDPLAPEEREEVSSVIRLQSRLARINVSFLGRGTVTGRVLYDDGTAVAAAAVTAASTLFSEVRSAISGPDGRFRLEKMPVGPVSVTARDADGRAASTTVAISGPGTSVETTLRLERTKPPRVGTVSGRVLFRSESASGPRTEPVDGARVAVYSAGAPYGEAVTGASGTFLFAGVPAGRVTLQAAEFTRSRTSAVADVDLAEDGTADATLILATSSPRAVAGRVLFRDPLAQADVPVSGAAVFVEGPGVFAVTDTAGDYRIDGVPAQGAGEAPYRVHAIDTVHRAEGTTIVSVTDASPDPVPAATIVLDSSTPGAIDGVVLDPLGRPAAGVTVTLVPLGETTTGGDGAFTFENVPVRAYTVAAHVATGLEPRGIGWIGEAPTEVLFGGHRAFATVRLRGAGTVNVRTRTASAGVKSPVAYKPTWFSPQELTIRQKSTGIETTTDDDGRLTLVLPVGELSVSASHPFHGTSSFRGAIDFAGQVKDVDLLFEEASTVSGVVVDVDGVTPVPGIDVALEAAGLLPQRQRTDGLGSFRFELVPPGGVSVTASGLRGAILRTGRTYGRVTGPGQVLELSVILKPQGTVRGRVVEESAPGVVTPLAGAQVALQENDFPFRRFPAAPAFLAAGGDGRFEIGGVSAGRLTVVVRDSRQVTRQGSRSGGLSSDFEVIDLGDVSLSGPVATLSVFVRDPESGAPVPDAQVFLSDGEATVAGSDGRAVFPALPLGRYSVHAFYAPTGRGGRLGDIDLAVAGQLVEAVVVLDQRGHVSGILFDDAARTNPVGGGTVRLEGTVNGRLWGAGIAALASTSREAGSTGSFSFDGLPVATYALTGGIEGSDRRASESASLTPTAPEASVALVLEPIRDVWVRLFRKEQARGLVEINPDPLRGDGVFAVSYGRDIDAYTGEPIPLANRLSPDFPYPGHGFRFQGVLASRSYWVRVLEAGGEQRRVFVSSSALLSGTSGAGTSADPYRIALLARGTARVTVRDAAGTAVAGVTVRIHAANGSWEGTTDSAGRAVFTAVEEGEVTVSASVPGSPLGAALTRSLRWDDEVLDVALTLAPVVAAHGTVYQPTGGDSWNGDAAGLTPAAGIVVRLRPATGDEQLLITGSDGVFRFSGLASGPYSIEARSLDGARIATATGTLGSVHGSDYALAPLVLDGSRPRVFSVTPPNGEALVSRTAPVEIVFSEPLSVAVLPSGPTSSFFRLSFSGTPASGSWSSSLDGAGRQVVRFAPSPRYENSTTYTLSIAGGPGGVRDREGRPLTDSGDVGSSFTTSDTDGPRVVGTFPSLARPVDPEAQLRVDFGEVLVLTSPQLQAAVRFEWKNGNGSWATFPVATSLTRGGYSILVTQPQGVAFADDSRRRRLTVAGLTDASGNPMPAWVGEYRILDANPPVLVIDLPPNAPTGDLSSSASYELSPSFGNLDDLTPENPFGDVDRVEYSFASAADPALPEAVPSVISRSAPFRLAFVAAYSGDGVTPRPFPVWVRAFDTSGNPSGVVRLAMRVLPNAPPSVGSVTALAVAPVAGTFYAGSTVSARATGIGDADDARLTLSAELRRGGAAGTLIATAPARTLDRPAQGWAALAPQDFSFVVPLTEAEGSFVSVVLRATDAKGAVGLGEAPFTVADDATPPVVSDLVARRPNDSTATSFLIGDTFVLEVRARDAETAVRSVTVTTTGGVLPATLEAVRVGATGVFRTSSVTVPSSLTEPVSIRVTATADDHGGNAGTATITIEAAPASDPTRPAAEWLSPMDRGLWPAGYVSVDAGRGGVDLLLRVRVTDSDVDASGQTVPGAFVAVRVRGPADAAGSLAAEWTPAALVSGSAGEWLYEAAWRVPNAVPDGTSLPFEVEVVDAGANREVRRATVLAVPARHVYESATTAVGPGSNVPAPEGAEALPVFLLDGTTLSLYPPAAGGPRSFDSLHLYSGGAWSAGPGSVVTVRRTILTAPEVGSYGSLETFYPLELVIGTVLAVGHGAAVDVSGRGLLGGDASHDPTVLPGERGSAARSAGSHGGLGHPEEGDWVTLLANPGSAYGNVREPRLPGGGAGRAGASGGGVVRIDASNATVRLFGDLAADGGSVPGSGSVGAAGGSVRLRAKKIEGRGSVHADGSFTPIGTSRPGGGGGRVAVSWGEPTKPAISVSARGAPSPFYRYGETNPTPLAGAGTVFLEKLDPSGIPVDRGTLRVANPASTFPPQITPLPGLGAAVVTAVDGAAGSLSVRSANAAGSIEGESVVVTTAPPGGGSPTSVVFPVIAQTRVSGSAGSPDQTFVLVVDASRPELDAIAAALSAGAGVSAKARLRFSAFEATGAVRVASGDDLEVGGVVNDRAALAVALDSRVALAGEAPVVDAAESMPAPGTNVRQGGTIDVRYRVTDPLGLAKIEESWSVTGVTSTRTFVEPLEAMSSGWPVRFTLPTNQPAGPVRFGVRAVDRAGRVTDRAMTWTVVGDTTPPAVTAIDFAPTRTGDAYVAGDVVTITARASDDVQLARILIEVDGRTAESASSPATLAWVAPPAVAVTSYAVVVTATDISGNSTTASRMVAVSPRADSTPPSVTLDCPSSGALLPSGYAGFRVQATASDDQGVRRVEVFRGDEAEPVAVVEAPSGSARTFEALSPGIVLPMASAPTAVRIRVRAWDFGGNASAEAEAQVTVVPAVPVSAAGPNDWQALETQTAYVASGTLVLDEPRTFGGLIVLRGASVTHSAGGSHRLALTVTGPLFVECGGSIDVTGRGYPPEATYPGERVPFGGAGSHVGTGGAWSSSGTGSTFGSVTKPQEPGGGGMGANGSDSGGGIARIRAGALAFGGPTAAILANGAVGGWQAGAGGSIWITASTISGDGLIQSAGGGTVSRGGGGAVAIEYGSATGTALTRANARGGGGGTATDNGGSGTVFLKGLGATYGTLRVDNGGSTGQPTVLPSLGSGTAQPGTAGAALVTDRGTPIPAYFVGHHVEITRGGVVLGTWPIGSVADRAVTLEPAGTEPIALQAGDVWQGVYRFDSLELAGASRVQSLDPIRTRSLGLDGPATADGTTESLVPLSAETVSVSGRVQVPGITATNLTVRSGSSLTHSGPTSTSTPGLDLNVSGRLTIEPGGSINATGKGYPADVAYPGAVLPLAGGGSHVGTGGVWYWGTSGTTYGSVESPREAGGGGRGTNGSGSGGGVLRIRAGVLAFGDSTASIVANGSAGGWQAGAGGSVWITTATMSGDGLIEAAGGTAGARGGGGAVAIEYAGASGAALNRANARGGGGGAAAENGGAGTVVLKGPGATYGTLRIDNGGSTGQSTVLPSLGGGTAQPGTSGATLVTDRSAAIPAYFVGHRVEITRSGAPLGTWRIGTIADRTVTLDPNGPEMLALQAGDLWQGAYRFDAVEVTGGAILRSADPVRDRAPSIVITGPASGASFASGAAVPVTFAATDDHPFVRVTLKLGSSVVVLPGPTASSGVVKAPWVASTTVVPLTATVLDTTGQSVETSIPLTILAAPLLTVSLAEPAAGAALISGTSETATVQLSDARPIRKVTLSVGTSVSEFSGLAGPRFSATFAVPVVTADETRSLVATVEDDTGSVASSAGVSVTVLADPNPRVTSSVNVPSPVAAGTSVVVSFAGLFLDPVYAKMQLRVSGAVTWTATVDSPLRPTGQSFVSTLAKAQTWAGSFPAFAIPRDARGPMTIDVTAVDSAGRSGPAVPIVRDVVAPQNAPPTVTLVEPSPTSRSIAVAGETLPVTVSVNDEAPACQLEIELGASLSRFPNTPKGTTVVGVPVPPVHDDQILALRATVVDDLGLSGSSESVPVLVLTSAVPRVEVAVEPAGPYEPGAILDVSFSTISARGAATAILEVSGSLTHTEMVAIPGAPTRYSGAFSRLSIPSDARGIATLVIRVVDARGQEGRATLPLRIGSDQPPTATLSVPATAECGETLDIALAATDDVGLTTARLTIAGAFEYSRLVTLGPSEGGLREVARTIRVPIPRYAQGTAGVSVEVLDTAGLSFASPVSAVTVADSRAPVISRIRSPQWAPRSEDFVSFGADVRDEGRIAEVRFFVDGTHFATATEPVRQGTYEVGGCQMPATAEPRTVLLRVEAEDAAGRVSPAERRFTVLPAAMPAVRFFVPSDGALAAAGTPVTVVAEVSHARPIVEVAFYRQGEGAPFAVVASGDGQAEYTVPEDAPDGSVIAFRVEAKDDAGAVGTATTSVRVVAGDVLEGGRVVEATDLSHEDRTVIVRGGEVTILGHHRFRRLLVLTNSDLSSGPGGDQPDVLDLEVTGDATVSFHGGLNANGRGYLGGLQGANDTSVGRTLPGQSGAEDGAGGSHGGRGQAGTGSDPGAPYGSLREPALPGAGGGAGGVDKPGGSGGGVVRLVVGGRFVLDGEINVNGESGGGGGVGAAGSVSVDASSIEGTGIIFAYGGTPWLQAPLGGSSGGGRIALRGTFGDVAPGATAASGPHLFSSGAPGTVFFSEPGDRNGHLVLDNGWCEQPTPTELVAVGSGVVSSVSGRSFRAAGSRWVTGVEGRPVEIRRGSDFVGRFDVVSLDAATQTLTLEEDAEGQLLAGDDFLGVEELDSVTVLGRARLSTTDRLEGRLTVEGSAGAAAPNVTVPPADAAPTVSASIPSRNVTAGSTVPVTVHARDDVGLDRIVLWIHGDDASRVELPVTGGAVADDRTVPYILPAGLGSGDQSLGIGVYDTAGQWTSTVWRLVVPPVSGLRVEATAGAPSRTDSRSVQGTLSRRDGRPSPPVLRPSTPAAPAAQRPRAIRLP